MKSDRFNNLALRTKNSLVGPLKERIFFLHIPKCGGVSITKAITNQYRTLDIRDRQLFANLNTFASFYASYKILNPESDSIIKNDFPVLDFREKLLSYQMCQDNIRCISGHFTFSESVYSDFQNKFSFITFLRDPIKRWISAYFYNQTNRNVFRRIEVDIDDYFNSEFARSQGYEFVKFIGGAREDGDYTSDEAISRAKTNLNKFHLVGFLEHMEQFEKSFEARFSRKIKVGHSNKNPKSKSERESLMTDEVKAKIMEICRPDIEVYQYAIDEFLVEHNTSNSRLIAQSV